MSSTDEDVSDVKRITGLQVPVNGETVSASRYTPIDVDEPLPGLLMYYPYRKDDHLVYGAYIPTIEYLAAHGYEVVTADMVGTGASTGRKSETGVVADEGGQGAAIVEWIADKGWCNGRVGMFGKSYGANNCFSAATQHPDPLEAIIPIMGGISSYHEVSHVGGAFGVFGRAGHWNPQMIALQTLPSSVHDEHGQWAKAWKDHLAEIDEGRPWLFSTMDHEQYDDYWAKKTLPVEEIKVPTFAVSGWRDVFPAPTLELAQRLEGPHRFLLGPWRHAMPHRGRETAIDFRAQMVEWFDHFLKDVDNEARSHPRITYWTEREGGGRIGAGTWRGTGDWPPEEGEQTFGFSSDGLVPVESFDSGQVSVEYEHDYTVGMYSPDDRPFAVPADVGPDDARSLTFESEPVESPIELTGTPEATIRLASTVADPTVVVRLVDVAPDGSARLVSHGRLRVAHRDGHETHRPLELDETYELSVPLKPKSHVFETGHRIRVAISAAFFPLVLPTASEPGHFIIKSAPSKPSVINLPGRVHGGGAEFDNAFEMTGPDNSHISTTSSWPTSKGGGWKTTRDQLTGEATVRTVMAYDMAVPHAESVTFDQQIEASAQPEDPTSYVIQSTTEMTIDDGREVARTLVHSRVDTESAQLSTEVTIGDQPVFEKTWIR